MKRICVVQDSIENPKAKVIEVPEDIGKTQAVLNFLRGEWRWDSAMFEQHCEEIKVLDLDDEEEPEDDVIVTVAVFMNLEPVSTVKGDRAFSCLIDICKGDKTVKEVLVKEGVGNALEDWNLTFKIPDELAVDVYCWVGLPLLTKEVSEGHILTHTVIGFVIPIDRELTTALKTIDINRLWQAPEGVVWCSKDAEDFSSHLQALCEDHQVDSPVPLE